MSDIKAVRAALEDSKDTGSILAYAFVVEGLKVCDEYGRTEVPYKAALKRNAGVHSETASYFIEMEMVPLRAAFFTARDQVLLIASILRAAGKMK